MRTTRTWPHQNKHKSSPHGSPSVTITPSTSARDLSRHQWDVSFLCNPTNQGSPQYSSGQTKTIDNIDKIIMATGFEHFNSLSILPESVLSKLEYSSTDPFSPLILDKGGTIRSEIQDIGFVGFYRGPYWGVMEMQARFLGSLWSDNKWFDYP